MKQLLFAVLLVISTSVTAQNVGIGTTTPDSSAKLDVTSVTKGFLPPRMTYAQRNAITSPAQGLMIYCLNCGSNGVPQYYNGTAWVDMVGSPAVLPGVKICNQVWMLKNLDVATYRNGDTIPQVTDNTVWSNLTTGAWCWYNNDSANYAATYGRLYNWHAVNDPRGLAPSGWHIPGGAELTTLINCLGGESTAGGEMKESGIIHWQTPNTGATNNSGFTGLPGGLRYDYGVFSFIGTGGWFWSSDEYSTTYAWYRYLEYYHAAAHANSYWKTYGFSVRCVRD